MNLQGLEKRKGYFTNTTEFGFLEATQAKNTSLREKEKQHYYYSLDILFNYLFIFSMKNTYK